MARRLRACGWKHCDVLPAVREANGAFIQGVFLFNRKTTISKNALKLSSKTLSSSTERSECTGDVFLREKILFFLTPLGNQNASA